jgi:hypothetical protein
MPGTLASLLIKLGLDATGVETGIAPHEPSELLVVGVSPAAGQQVPPSP